MNRVQMAKVMDQMFSECQDLRSAGQKEYAHKEENAFRNFEIVGDLLAVQCKCGESVSIPRETVLAIYWLKHVFGIIAYINGHESQREDVRGRINDCVVYEGLLRGMLEDNAARIATILRNEDQWEVLPGDMPLPVPGRDNE